MILANLRAGLWKYLAIAGGVLAVALLITALAFRASGVSARADADRFREEASAAKAQVEAISLARDKEAAAAKRANAIADQYEKDKRYAEAIGKRASDELRAGTIRLRQQWQGCASVPTPAGTTGEPDAAAESRVADSGNLVRVGAESDAQVRALQQFILSERGALQ